MAAISQSDIGKRVTVRLRDGDGYRDLVGFLLSPTTLKNRHGQVVEFDPAEVHIWRVINEVPRTASSGAPLSIRVTELERTLSDSWVAKEEENLGGLLLRADNGITKRANSALVLNAEKLTDQVIDQVIGWYRARNLNPTFALISEIHKQLDTKLIERGFTEFLDAQVMVKDHLANELASLENLDSDGAELLIEDFPDSDWLATQNDEQIAELMQRSPAKYLTLKSKSGEVLAVGRVGFAADWAVLSRIWVDPNSRGKGFGKLILQALESVVDAPKIALQVATSNQTAINLYQSAGYKTHHEYRFRWLPQRIDLIQDLCC